MEDKNGGVPEWNNVLDLLELADLTPNEYCILYSIYYGKSLPTWNTINPEIRKLKTQEWLSSNNDLLGKSIDLITLVENSKDKKVKIPKVVIDLKKVKEYNDLFPNIKFPSGVPAQTTVNLLRPRFEWFFANHEYTWDQVIEVTKRYLDEKEKLRWDMAICSKYLVKKRNKIEGGDESVLAELCNLYINGNYEEPKENIFKENTF